VDQLLAILEVLPAATKSVNCANLEFEVGVLKRLATQCSNANCD